MKITLEMSREDFDKIKGSMQDYTNEVQKDEDVGREFIFLAVLDWAETSILNRVKVSIEGGE